MCFNILHVIIGYVTSFIASYIKLVMVTNKYILNYICSDAFSVHYFDKLMYIQSATALC